MPAIVEDESRLLGRAPTRRELAQATVAWINASDADEPDRRVALLTMLIAYVLELDAPKR